MSTAQKLADRYVAVWNEHDSNQRREAITTLWVPGGVHFVAGREARDYDALEQRVLDSHLKWVEEEGCRFRAVANAQSLHDVVTFNWEMLGSDGTVRSVGLQFLKVDAEYRILVDYQFIVTPP